MSFVPDIQNYFGKGTDFTKLGNAYSNGLGMNYAADIKGDLMKSMAKGRAEMRINQGKAGLAAGQQAGSNAAWGGAISGIGSAVTGGLRGGFSDGGIFNQSTDVAAPKFGLDNGFGNTWNEGFGVGGYTPSEILNTPNIGYNPFG